MQAFDFLTTTPRLEPIEYIRKPQVACRCIAVILSIVVISVVHVECSMLGHCLFNDDNSSCGFSLFLGWTTMIMCILFLVLDLWVDNVSNCNIRKRIVLADFGLTSVWSFLWFVGFCLLCNRWQNTLPEFLDNLQVSLVGPRVAIAFTFFTTMLLTILCYFCYLSHTAVQLLLADLNTEQHNPVNSFGGYTDPSPTNYHGFTGDSDILDVSRPPGLVPAMGGGGAGVFPSSLAESYQP